LSVKIVSNKEQAKLNEEQSKLIKENEDLNKSTNINENANLNETGENLNEKYDNLSEKDDNSDEFNIVNDKRVYKVFEAKKDNLDINSNNLILDLNSFNRVQTDGFIEILDLDETNSISTISKSSTITGKLYDKKSSKKITKSQKAHDFLKSELKKVDEQLESASKPGVQDQIIIGLSVKMNELSIRMNELIELVKVLSEQVNQQKDPLNYFFNSIFDSIKKLSDEEQEDVKYEIMKIIRDKRNKN
jgi:hypothetical protein